jgi:hypothetical protein
MACFKGLNVRNIEITHDNENPFIAREGRNNKVNINQYWLQINGILFTDCIFLLINSILNYSLRSIVGGRWSQYLS